MQENHLGWKFLQGVREDVTNLFKEFAKTNSVRYEDFCKVWKEMNFSLIYSNRPSFLEKLEFSEELLHIVKEYLSSVYEFPTRVGALYTLYGLYFKQPIKDAAKIRFTKSEWEDVESFTKACIVNKHFDVAFIHYKLYQCGAYTFTATIRATCPEHGFSKYLTKKITSLPNSFDTDLLRRPLISERLVDSLVQLESLYCRKKSELLGKQNLVFIDGTFAKKLQEELKSYATSSKKMSDGEEAGPSEVFEKKNICDDTSRRRRSKRKNKTTKELNDQVKANRKVVGPRYIDLLAKKKAEACIKKSKEDCIGTEETELQQFELPDLNFFSVESEEKG